MLNLLKKKLKSELLRNYIMPDILWIFGIMFLYLKNFRKMKSGAVSSASISLEINDLMIDILLFAELEPHQVKKYTEMTK